jgi:hypothetical protein
VRTPPFDLNQDILLDNISHLLLLLLTFVDLFLKVSDLFGNGVKAMAIS